MTRYFTFIGVTTAESSIMRIFPRWRERLDLGPDVEIAGWDLPINAPAMHYRAAIQTLKSDPNNLGGLVTTHKIDLYRAARDLFDEVDHYARLCEEVSCLAKRDGRLFGWAKDPISSGKTLRALLGPDYFGRTGGHVLCFGAGGTGLAITLYLMSHANPGDRPTRIVVTDRRAERLEGLQTVHRQVASDVRTEYVENADPRLHDVLMARLPPRSLVINATGMGKDIPGSPITEAARFPENGIAWDLNYRGELGFLHQAWAQRDSCGVRVEDGWQYFIFGWTTIIEEVFNRPISREELQALSRDAEFARPAQPTRQRVTDP